MKKKNAFTLIELLAVIVILAIIALIATPIILGIIEDAKKDAFLRSVELVVSTTDMDIGTKPYDSYYTYTITDGDISNLDIPIKNTDGMNGSIKYDKEGNTAYAVNNGKYCVVKEYEGQAILKDYDETCGYIDYPDNDCFVVEGEIIDYEITDKTTCQNFWKSSGMSSYATAICNDESVSVLGGISLTQFMKQNAATRAQAFVYGVTPVYGENNKTERIADYVCTDNNIIIPDQIDGHPITGIGEYAFTNKNLVGVKISDGIQTIGNYAFDGNQLTNVEIPDSVTSIGTFAFSNNKLTSIEIPSSITIISWGAFSDNKLKSVDILDTVTSIEDYAFRSNQLTSIEIPDSVTSIGVAAFTDNRLSDEEAFIYKRNSDGSIDNTTLISYGGKKRDNVVIPSNVKTIGENSFIESQITSIEIPTSVTSIESFAFNGNQLTSLIIPDSVTSIGMQAFAFNQLTSIKISNNITNIETGVFGNNKLSGELDLTYLTNLTTIGNSAFSGHPDGSTNQITSIKLPSSVTKIGSYAFQNNALTSVTFYGRSDLTGVIVGSNAWGWATDHSDADIHFEPTTE